MSTGILAEDVARALWPNSKAGDYHARGVVTGVSGTTVSVRLRDAETPTACGKLASCSPKAGDLVLVLVMPSGSVVLGTIG